MSTYRFSVVIEKDIDGYFAFCPNFSVTLKVILTNTIMRR